MWAFKMPKLLLVDVVGQGEPPCIAVFEVNHDLYAVAMIFSLRNRSGEPHLFLLDHEHRLNRDIPLEPVIVR
jgi:hypothetical protein